MKRLLQKCNDADDADDEDTTIIMIETDGID